MSTVVLPCRSKPSRTTLLTASAIQGGNLTERPAEKEEFLVTNTVQTNASCESDAT